MSKEFQPHDRGNKNRQFSTWEYSHIKEASAVTEEQQKQISEQDILMQEAIEKGYAEGLQRAAEEINAQKTELVHWLELIKKPVQLLDDKLIQEIIQTVVWLCQYCIGVTLNIDSEQLRALFDKIKEELPSLQGNKVLSMHPQDMEWIKEHISDKDVAGLHDILVGDPMLNRGDFYLQSEHSELDGRLHTRLITLFAKYINKDEPILPLESQDES